MPEPLIEAISIQDDDYILIKFETSLRRASITDQRFKLKTTGATPNEVAGAFDPIDIDTDYNSLSKILKLHFKKDILEPGATYILEISGLQNAIGTTLSTVSYQFTADSTFEDDYTKPDEPAIVIEDHSIKDDIYIDTGSATFRDFTLAANNEFRVKSVTPTNNSVYLSEDENNGVIEREFSERVAEENLNANYFKVQRKKVQRGPSRWEFVNAEIEANATSPIVYIKLPSNEASPSFNLAGKTYFEDGYKYRIIVSRYLKTAS